MKKNQLKSSCMKSIALLFLIMFSQSAFSLTSSNGNNIELTGEFTVFGGEVNYSLPILVTPGRAGHQPSLSFEYQSDLSNGLLGMGWRVGGLSNITRCGKNIEKDSSWGGVNFDNEDRYCLDGQRLIAISGKDGEHLTEYRTEINGYEKIVSFGRQGNGPKYFKIWNKDGYVYEYGLTDDARAELPNQLDIYKWSLNKITDKSSENEILFRYNDLSDIGSHYINEIIYVGGKIVFNYEDRQDKTEKYLGGSLLKRDKIIKSVDTYNSYGNKIGSYQLNYTQSTSTDRSVLTKIRYCSINGSCSSGIDFHWKSQRLVSLDEPTDTGYNAPKYYDRDGDGIAEIYGVVEVQSNNKLLIKDINGQLHRDISSFTLVGNLASGKALELALNSCNLNVASYYRKANGDIVPYCTFSESNINVGINNTHSTHCEVGSDGKPMGNLFSCLSSSSHNNTIQKIYNSNGIHYGDFNGDGNQTPQSGFLVADINGDGIDDRYNFDNPDAGYKYIISGGSEQVLSNVQGRVLKSIADINNDGYLDVIMGPQEGSGNLVVYEFDGKKFVNSRNIDVPSVDGEYSIAFSDLNNDGYPELAIDSKFYRNVRGNITNQVMLDVGESIYSTQDINGDGWSDVLTRSNSANAKVKIRKSQPNVQDKIEKIKELSGEYIISYGSYYGPIQSISGGGGEVVQKPRASGLIQPKKPSKYTVNRVIKTVKGYPRVVNSYNYTDPMYHINGGGFLGFGKIIETKEDINKTVTEIDFDQTSIQTAGKPLSVKVVKNDKLISYKKYLYSLQARQGYNAKYYQVYANEMEEKLYDFKSGRIERKEITQNVLDRFGNVLENNVIITSDFSQAGKFKLTNQYEYLSTGINHDYHIYDVTTVSNVINLKALLTSYKSGLSRYCSTNGEIFFKPNDNILLIHGEVDVPLVLHRYNDYYKYKILSSHTDLDGLTVYSGSLISVSEENFNSSNLQSCGSYSLTDYDNDGNLEFSTSRLTKTELVTESGDNFWKIGAVKLHQSKVEDISNENSPQVRTVLNRFSYTNKGFLEQSETTSSDYESTGEISTSSKLIKQIYRYDVWGNITEQSVLGSDLAERKTTTQYDEKGLYPKSVVNALGHVTKMVFNEQGLLIQSSSALKSRTSSYQYDAFGRLISETLPGVNNTNTTDYLLGESCPYPLPQTVSCTVNKLAVGGEVITHFDHAGSEIRRLHTGFSGQYVVVDTEWDTAGRKVSITRPQFIGSTSPAPKVTFKYDLLNREIEKSEPTDRGGRSVFKTAYEGNVTTITDAKGNIHKTLTNVMGFIVRKDEPLGAFQTYSYYPDGKLRSSTDSAGNTTQIRYDNLGYRTYLDDPDMGEWNYSYNALGELIYKRDANGIETKVEYDLLGRKTKQSDGSSVSQWRYDERGAIGTLSGFSGNGSQTDYYYNTVGLTEEISVKVNNEKFSTHYFYDGFERVIREVRPNGIDTTLAGVATKLAAQNTQERLAVEYVYNPYGYVAAVRSPKTYADEVFTSASFREDIRQLLAEAIAQANQYLNKAERYATQQSFFTEKADEYSQKTVNVHNLDASSQALLGNGYRYKQWCNAQGSCYLRPATWVMLHDEVTTPIDVTLQGAIFRLTTELANSQPGIRNFNAAVHPVSLAEFDSQNLTQSHDFLLTDYDANGQKDLMSNKDIYIAQADSQTREELLFTAEDLAQAATIAQSNYKFYTELASNLINLSEQVAQLSGLYCEFTNQLGGSQVDQALRKNCTNTQQSSQADHLNLILTQSELEDSLSNPACIYYWQRRETDAYDHTLSETLGNGLVNTYSHDPNTGRPAYITTHKANRLFEPRLKGATSTGRNIRYIEYRYDNHNNVISRYDEQLGITDKWVYDAQDRVISNQIFLSKPAQHGENNPDLSGPFNYQYDQLGNLKFKTNIGGYEYGSQQAGPHVVTQANGLSYQYDQVGNMLRAYAANNSMNERELEWSTFNKPTKITRNGKSVQFFYDANHERYLKRSSDGIETFYFGKTYERVINRKTGEIEHKQFVYADGKLIALNIQTQDAQNKLKDKQIRYLHYDALNSIDMITDGYGLVVERRSYNTWGKQRKVAWRETGALEVVQEALTNRGFTGHEEISEVGLVHMNGRVYDQELGRFISPDPIVQAPFSTVSFNRYAYVWNNPLKYIDPTGFWSVEETDLISGETTTVDFPDDVGTPIDNGNDKDHNNWGGGNNNDQSSSSIFQWGNQSFTSHNSGDGTNISWGNEAFYQTNPLDPQMVKAFWELTPVGVGISILDFGYASVMALDLTWDGEYTDAALTMGYAAFGIISKKVEAAKDLYKVTKGLGKSPHIDPKDIANKTPAQIDKLAKDKGLVPKGPDPMSGKGAYVDPATEKQRVLCHTNCSNPHGHVNNAQGQRLDIDGNVVAPESPAAHLPINFP
ncbi:type IV secretion protein Rhs [Vibrio cholerae]|nr:type IV secretion protein Rhs [Vibrio cholerae]